MQRMCRRKRITRRKKKKLKNKAGTSEIKKKCRDTKIQRRGEERIQEINSQRREQNKKEKGLAWRNEIVEDVNK